VKRNPNSENIFSFYEGLGVKKLFSSTIGVTDNSERSEVSMNTRQMDFLLSISRVVD
jgi:hypothetical protein